MACPDIWCELMFDFANAHVAGNIVRSPMSLAMICETNPVASLQQQLETCSCQQEASGWLQRSKQISKSRSSHFIVAVCITLYHVSKFSRTLDSVDSTQFHLTRWFVFCWSFSIVLQHVIQNTYGQNLFLSFQNHEPDSGQNATCSCRYFRCRSLLVASMDQHLRDRHSKLGSCSFARGRGSFAGEWGCWRLR